MKILIAAPTAYVKKYCMDKWVENTSSLICPEDATIDIYLSDNSTDREFYVESKEKYGHLLTIERISSLHAPSVKSAMAHSHEKCRQRAISGGYDWWLHKETDVISPLDVIQQLLERKKKVIGAMYHIELGGESKLMIQEIEDFGDVHRESYNLDQSDLSFVDGTVKKVFSPGLGCTLIHRSVFTKFGFRYEEGSAVHPDSFFFGDLSQNGVPVFVDTSIYCEHDNQALTRF